MAEQSPFIGRTIGRYKIIERLGRGGMAEVYKGYLEALDRVVAIKIMHPFLSAEAGFLGRFQREAKAMAALNHPNIASVYDFDVQGDTYYIVMEFIAGGTLRDQLEALARRGERMSLAAAVRLVLELADALAYAHARGTFHRDVKPGNIMLREDGSAVLTDFGIARNLSGPSYTMTGAMLGTPAYMSPEQALGQTGDERSDIYALGVLFFQVVTGRLPFDADTPLAVAMKHVHEPVPSPIQFNPQTPEGIQRIILKALAKEPAARFQTAHEMGKALRAVLAHSANQSLAAALPAELLQDRPTPLPTTGRPPVGPAEATQVSPVVASRTQVARGPSMGETEVAIPLPPQRPPAPAQTRPKRAWLWAVGAAGLLLLSGLVVVGIILAGQERDKPTPSAGGLATQVVLVATSTPTLPPASPTLTPDVVETELAKIRTTLTAAAPTATTPPILTDTPIPTVAAASSPAPPPEATAIPTPVPTKAVVGPSSGSGLPLGFETFGVWTLGDQANGAISQSSERMHSGTRSAKLSYDFGTADNDFVVFLQSNTISGSPNTLQLWVYGDGSGHFLNVWIEDANGQTWQVPLGQVFHTGWQQMTGYVVTGQNWPWTHIGGPNNGLVDYPIRFRAFVLDDYANSYTGSGAIYLDDLTATTVENPPVIASPAVPTPGATAAATPAATTAPGTLGRILYTAGNTILTTDPDWTAPREIGTAAVNTCSSPASTITGQTFNLYTGPKCITGASINICLSPDGQYEAVISAVDANTVAMSARPAGDPSVSNFVYQGPVDHTEGLRWSPLSNSFLFVVGDTVYMGFPGGGFNQIIPIAYEPIFSPDGAYLLYRKPIGPGVNDVFVSNADGSNARNVTNVAAIDKQCAAWRN